MLWAYTLLLIGGLLRSATAATTVWATRAQSLSIISAEAVDRLEDYGINRMHIKRAGCLE